jgi:hypothetical protein
LVKGGGDEFGGLVDDVRLVEGDALGVEEAGWSFARGCGAGDVGCAGEAGDDGGADVALEVDGEFVMLGAEFFLEGEDGREEVERGPGAGVDEVSGVDERGGEERGPAWVDGPAYVGVGEGGAEGGNGWESVENVAHGTDAEDKDARVGHGVLRALC